MLLSFVAPTAKKLILEHPNCVFVVTKRPPVANVVDVKSYILRDSLSDILGVNGKFEDSSEWARWRRGSLFDFSYFNPSPLVYSKSVDALREGFLGSVGGAVSGIRASSQRGELNAVNYGLSERRDCKQERKHNQCRIGIFRVANEDYELLNFSKQVPDSIGEFAEFKCEWLPLGAIGFG
jgi:hypothetical protein